jgi:hypothetical protein
LPVSGDDECIDEVLPLIDFSGRFNVRLDIDQPRRKSVGSPHYSAGVVKAQGAEPPHSHGCLIGYWSH